MFTQKNHLLIAILAAFILPMTVGCGDIDTMDDGLIIVAADLDTEAMAQGPPNHVPAEEIPVGTVARAVHVLDDPEIIHNQVPRGPTLVDAAESPVPAAERVQEILRFEQAGDAGLIDEFEAPEEDDALQDESVDGFADGCVTLEAWKHFAGQICVDVGAEVSGVQPKNRCADGRYRQVVMSCDVDETDEDSVEGRTFSALVLGGPDSCKSYDAFKARADDFCTDVDSFVFDIAPIGRCDRSEASDRFQAVRVVCAKD